MASTKKTTNQIIIGVVQWTPNWVLVRPGHVHEKMRITVDRTSVFPQNYILGILLPLLDNECFIHTH